MATRFFPNYDALIVTSPFGMRTLGSVTRMHSGIDLVAKGPKGGKTDFVTAHTGGTVAAVGYNDSCGNYINIQCGDALMVYYHLKDKPAFQVGEAVAAGQVIGYMGATGRVTGAHLHFGIKEKGKWIDPAPFLDKDYGQVEQPSIEIGLNLLQSGATGESVKALQSLLTGRGFPAKADGIFGPATAGAVRAYQETAGLAADGIVGILTWRALLGVA